MRRLPHRAEAHHVAAQTGGHREHRVHDRARLPGCLQPATDPRRANAQGFSTAVTRPPSDRHPPPPGYVESPSMSSRRSPASSIARTHASTVSDSGSRISRRPSSTSRSPRWRPCLRTCRMMPSAARAGLSVFGRKRPGLGIAGGYEQWEPHVGVLSNSTATLIPVCTASGAHPTTFVVRRTRSSSSSATIAMTYGGVIAGSHWWTFTVYPTTVPRPETSTMSIWVESQYGQTGVGGKSNAPHGMLRCTRKAPSRPARPEELVLGRELRQRARLRDASVFVIGPTLNAPTSAHSRHGYSTLAVHTSRDADAERTVGRALVPSS